MGHLGKCFKATLRTIPNVIKINNLLHCVMHKSGKFKVNGLALASMIMILGPIWSFVPTKNAFKIVHMRPLR